MSSIVYPAYLTNLNVNDNDNHYHVVLTKFAFSDDSQRGNLFQCSIHAC